jgi:hypothetical protein
LDRQAGRVLSVRAAASTDGEELLLGADHGRDDDQASTTVLASLLDNRVVASPGSANTRLVAQAR